MRPGNKPVFGALRPDRNNKVARGHPKE